MKVLVAFDSSAYFYEGKYYFASQHYTIMKNYYDSFGKLIVFGRLKKLEEPTLSYIDVTDMIEEYVEIGSLYKTMLGAYNSKIREVAENCDLIIGRCNGIVPFEPRILRRSLRSRIMQR